MSRPEPVRPPPPPFQPPNLRALTPITTLFPDLHNMPTRPPAENGTPSPQTPGIPPPLSSSTSSTSTSSPLRLRPLSYKEYPGTSITPAIPYHAGLPAFSSPSFDIRAASLAPRTPTRYPTLRPITRQPKRAATKASGKDRQAQRRNGNGNGIGNRQEIQEKQIRIFSLVEPHVRTSAERALGMASPRSPWNTGWKVSVRVRVRKVRRPPGRGAGEEGKKEEPVVG
ncbi:hypothetical protein F5B19DRAFT_494837 [Rostrohypoxylon terebratum]|nr:hypothetical protein F5B19DRAFT_494837 [Rostrohypoxylon terebratum]